MKVEQPLISVIVPTYNSAHILENFLESLQGSEEQDFEVIINDDVRSTDDTKRVVDNFRRQGLRVNYLQENYSMAQGRKAAAKVAIGQIFLHLDSDMEVTVSLLGECADMLRSGFDALIIPEVAFGTTFWAKCKRLEKKCYEGVDEIESLRCLKRSIYWEVGGHNETMVFSEDKDLDIRVRSSGAIIGRTKNALLHNEGNLQLIKTLRKKRDYTQSANIFAAVHPIEYKWQVNLLNRYVIYFRNVKYLFDQPVIYIGMVFMKTAEFGMAGLYIALKKMGIRKINHYLDNPKKSN